MVFYDEDTDLTYV